MKKNIKLNALLNMIKTISSIAFPLITFPYASRVLKPGNMGKVNFGLSFVSYFSLIASLGITTYAIRECSSKRENKSELSDTASQIFSINVFTTIFAYIAMAVTLMFFRRFDSYRMLIIIQSLTIVFTTIGCDWLNQAMEDFQYITIRTIAFQIISLVLLFAFVKTPNDYIKYAAITVLSSSGANIVNVVYIKRFCKVRFTRKINWKYHFRPILLLFVMLLAQTIFNSSDQTMLGLMKGDFEVGIYSTAVKISNVISQIVTSLLWVLLPRLSTYFENNDYENINRLLNKVFGIFLTLGVPLAVGTICLSRNIVLILSGKEYVAASDTLRILMLSFIFDLYGGAFLGNMVLLPSKREKTFMFICCVATGVNFILNLIFIPIWGANAAALTTAIATFLMAVLLQLKKDKKVVIEFKPRVLFPPIVGCISIALVCFVMLSSIKNYYASTIVSVLISITVYYLIQMAMKNNSVIELTEAVLKRLKWNNNN